MTNEFIEEVKKTLIEAFPESQFSIVGYMEGNHSVLSISWIDGPTEKSVRKLTNIYELDRKVDPDRYQVHKLQVRRRYSSHVLDLVEDHLIKKWEIKDKHDSREWKEVTGRHKHFTITGVLEDKDLSEKTKVFNLNQHGI